MQKNYNARLLAEARSLDMAIEAHSLLKGDGDVELEGVRHSEREFKCGKTVTIEILNKQGAKTLGRDIGHYITIELPGIHEADAASLIEPASAEIAKVLAKMLPRFEAGDARPILLAGLGNFQTTADAIGPRVISHIQPTNHFFRREFASEIRPVAAITPGVVGNTGVETAALIKGVAGEIDPAALVVIDALAARSIGGVMSSIQICDTGIRPGSGVQNHRRAINREYLGVPVLAVGIPTVVQAQSIIRESASLCLMELDVNRADLPEQVAEQMLSPFEHNLVMTPKEADELVPLASLIIAAGITRALHPGASDGSFAEYMQGV
ncbi:MAG TPA: GPR endopeptidase [Candidatus Avidehalobacter gallistercoris]|uniref:Germination protease n=1 Tax=Candidatus Avidehalobacter gallistercoris TaxID=2840694 RepID=A0A9D1HIV7_9FIRM|nr:GPR endopeptidase [Candidatus Avidehalobacter gallistercoris]